MLRYSLTLLAMVANSANQSAPRIFLSIRRKCNDQLIANLPLTIVASSDVSGLSRLQIYMLSLNVNYLGTSLNRS